MCCFSRKVDVVADTNIFARAGTGGRQFLVYGMKFKAGEDLAMILPIPTPKNSPEDAVRFIGLEKYAGFFEDLKTGFPEPPPTRAKDDNQDAGRPRPKALAVVEVGDFEASFVPAVKDFARLDARFRLADGVWEKLPQYADFGFAVFRLKKPKAGGQKVHPMAFDFPRADTGVLFFPTVHVHDGGTVPAKATFDHALFCQTPDAPLRWEESPGLAESFVTVKDARGIVDGTAHVYRRVLKGTYANKDVGV